MQDWNISGKSVCAGSLGLSCLWGVAFWFCAPPQPILPAYLHWVSLWLLGCLGIAAAVVDFRSHLLPDVFTLHAGIPALLLCSLSGAYTSHSLGYSFYGGLPPLVGAILGFALVKGLQWMLRRQKGSEQLGSGDAKFMLLLGALVGVEGLIPTLILACLLLWPFFRIRKTPHLPFGPSLMVSAIIVTLTGVRWPV